MATKKGPIIIKTTPNFMYSGHYSEDVLFECPICHKRNGAIIIDGHTDTKFCQYCGARLDWDNCSVKDYSKKEEN